jgi:hypothetical protein
LVPTLYNRAILSPGEARNSIPTKLWSRPQKDASVLVATAILNRKQDMIDTEPILGTWTQAMALKDDIWDIDMLS